MQESLEWLISTKRGRHHYPLFFHEVAEIIGGLRQASNRPRNEVTPGFVGRGDKTETVNPLGVLAEMVAQYVFYANQIEYRGAPLLADQPVTEGDIQAGPYIFDVKGVRTDGWDLLVNEDVHNNEKKRITHYIHIQAIGGIASYWINSHAEVCSWRVKKVLYTNAYYKPIKDT